MNILLTILAILIALLMYLLLMPLSIKLNIIFDKRARVAIGLGLFPFKLHFKIGQTAQSKRGRNEDKRIKPARVKTAKGSLSFDDIKLLMRVMIQFIRFSLRLVRLPGYHCRLSFAGGVGAPDITGQLYGIVQSVKPVLPESISLEYKPDFVVDGITGEMECGLVIRPIMLVKGLFVFLVSLPLIKIYKIFRKLK